MSGSSAFSKTILNIWYFMVHVLPKPGLENFKKFLLSKGEFILLCNRKNPEIALISSFAWLRAQVEATRIFYLFLPLSAGFSCVGFILRIILFDSNSISIKGPPCRVDVLGFSREMIHIYMNWLTRGRQVPRCARCVGKLEFGWWFHSSPQASRLMTQEELALGFKGRGKAVIWDQRGSLAERIFFY